MFFPRQSYIFGSPHQRIWHEQQHQTPPLADQSEEETENDPVGTTRDAYAKKIKNVFKPGKGFWSHILYPITTPWKLMGFAVGEAIDGTVKVAKSKPVENGITAVNDNLFGVDGKGGAVRNLADTATQATLGGVIEVPINGVINMTKYLLKALWQFRLLDFRSVPAIIKTVRYSPELAYETGRDVITPIRAMVRGGVNAVFKTTNFLAKTFLGRENLLKTISPRKSKLSKRFKEIWGPFGIQFAHGFTPAALKMVMEPMEAYNRWFQRVRNSGAVDWAAKKLEPKKPIEDGRVRRGLKEFFSTDLPTAANDNLHAANDNHAPAAHGHPPAANDNHAPAAHGEDHKAA